MGSQSLLRTLLRRKEIFNGTCCKVKSPYFLFAFSFCNSVRAAAFAPNHVSRDRFLWILEQRYQELDEGDDADSHRSVLGDGCRWRVTSSAALEPWTRIFNCNGILVFNKPMLESTVNVTIWSVWWFLNPWVCSSVIVRRFNQLSNINIADNERLSCEI